MWFGSKFTLQVSLYLKFSPLEKISSETSNIICDIEELLNTKYFRENWYNLEKLLSDKTISLNTSHCRKLKVSSCSGRFAKESVFCK